MKKLLFIFTIFISSIAFAQSPSLSTRLKMDVSGSVKYKIEMKICEPINPSASNGYFNNDTSTINFKVLTASQINCGEYISNYDGEKIFNKYHYSNQFFSWEKIIIWKIMNWSSRGWHEPMYIILPIKMKSFVTHIEINDIVFQSDKVVWLDEVGKIGKDKQQVFNLSLKNIVGTAVENCTLNALLN